MNIDRNSYKSIGIVEELFFEANKLLDEYEESHDPGLLEIVDGIIVKLEKLLLGK